MELFRKSTDVSFLDFTMKSVFVSIPAESESEA